MDGQRMDRRRDGWTETWVDGQSGEWMGGQRDGWMDRWMDRQACCGMPSAQPGFHAVASLIPASCLLPQFPQHPPKTRLITPAWEAPWVFHPVVGVPSSRGVPAVPSSLSWGLRLNLAQGWHPGTHHPCARTHWWAGGWHSPLGAVSRRWWQQDFSPAVDDSQESHVFPG